MAKVKFPEGLVSKDTKKALTNAAFLKRVKARRAIVKESVSDSGRFPQNGDVKLIVTSFDLKERRSDKGKGKLFADDYLFGFKVKDNLHKQDGMTFRHGFRIFTNPKNKKGEDIMFSMGAAQLKQLLMAALPEEQVAMADDEMQWPVIIAAILECSDDMVFNCSCSTTETTSEKDGKVYPDHSLRTFGQVDDEEEVESEEDDESEEVEAEEVDDEEEESEEDDESEEDEDEDEDEEDESEGDEEDEESEDEDEGVEILVGSKVDFVHPKKKKEYSGLVIDLDDDEGEVTITWKEGKKKKKATFSNDVITAVE